MGKQRALSNFQPYLEEQWNVKISNHPAGEQLTQNLCYVLQEEFQKKCYNMISLPRKAIYVKFSNATPSEILANN